MAVVQSELIIGNLVRRVLYIIREEYQNCQRMNNQSASSSSQQQQQQRPPLHNKGSSTSSNNRRDRSNSNISVSSNSSNKQVDIGSLSIRDTSSHGDAHEDMDTFNSMKGNDTDDYDDDDLKNNSITPSLSLGEAYDL